MSHASHLEAVLSWCDKFENLDEDGVRPASQNVFGAELPPSIDETPGDIKEAAEVIKGTAPQMKLAWFVYIYYCL